MAGRKNIWLAYDFLYGRPWHNVSMNFITSLLKSQGKYAILVMVDCGAFGHTPPREPKSNTQALR
jgi:hypothetical protein